jgi:rare lipoprotein A
MKILSFNCENSVHTPKSGRRLKTAFLLIALGGLAGCASTGQNGRLANQSGDIDPRLGVRASPRVVADGEEVPKGGGGFMVGKPYKIAGKTYVPNEKPYAVEGTASWYGADFHGRRTANGEIFDRKSISAAHPTMPLPSYARVTNLRNSRSMIVRVNDRGPYHGGRVMDVSQRVAEALDFRSAGTARVKVEWVSRAKIGGDDDAYLLATLRDDAPAALDNDAPVLTALREEATEIADLPSRAEAVRVAAAETITETENAALAYTEDQSSPNGASAPVLNEIAPKPAKKLAKLTPPLPPKRH